MSDINFCNTKEQLSHLGEVVTGKVNGSPTGDDIDTSTLPYTGQVRKTLPALEEEYQADIDNFVQVSDQVITDKTAEFDTSIANKEAEADAAIDDYRLLSKGPYAAGILLEDKFQYITYSGESYFAVNPPYTTTATTPDADGNLFIGGYTTFENVANKIGNKNELSNSNFLTPSPDAITHPNATPESYVVGTQIFSGVYAGDSGCTVTFIDGRVNCTAGDYQFKVANTNGLNRVPVFASSVSDYDGKPKTTGVSYALVGDEYVVTVTPAAGDVFSVKFEQGGVATWHEVGANAKELSHTGDSQIVGNIWPVDSTVSADEIAAPIPFGTSRIRLVGGDFAEITQFKIVQQSSASDVASGTLTNVNLTVKPYTATIGLDDVWLCRTDFHSVFVSNARAFWSDNTGASFVDDCDRAAKQNAANKGIPFYLPSGKYLLELQNSINFWGSDGVIAKNFVGYGNGDSSEYIVDVNADPNFKSPFSSGAQQVDGFKLSGIQINFNKDRVRATPTDRFHNPLVQITNGGSGVDISDVLFTDANVDQPIRIASFNTPTPAGEFVNKINIDKLRFERFHDGVPGNDQVDISCLYIVGNDVEIHGINFDSGIGSNMKNHTNKGITCIEFYGSDLRAHDNSYNFVNRAHIIGNQSGDYTTDKISIYDSTYFGVICGLDCSPMQYESGDISFKGSKVYNNESTSLSLPFFLLFSISGGSNVSPINGLTIENSEFYFKGSGSYTTNSYSSLVGAGDVRYLVFESNTVNDHPTGVINYYAGTAAPGDVDCRVESNTFKNIRTQAQQAGAGRPFNMDQLGSKNIKNLFYINNTFENIWEKTERTGTGSTGPISYINISNTILNYVFKDNLILGPNLPNRTDGNFPSATHSVIRDNDNVGETD